MKRLRRLLLIVSAMLVSGVSMADGWSMSVVPAFDFATKQSSFTLNGSATDILVRPTYSTLVPSLAVSYGPIYGVVSYETPLAPWQGTRLDMSLDTYKQTTFDRHETAFTLGYRLPHSVNVFVGYIHGQSRQTDTWYINYQVTPGVWEHRIWPTTYEFDERGFFGGLSYGHTFGEKGSLSVSAAAGYLDGKFTILDYNGTVDPNLFYSTSKTEYTAKALGYSASLGWSGPINANMVYRVGMKYTKYIFDNETYVYTTPTGSYPGPATSQIVESIYSVSIGVANYF